MSVLQKNAYHCDTFPGFYVTDGTLAKGEMWEMSVSFCIFGSCMRGRELFNGSSSMGTDRTDKKTYGKWVVVRIDGKIAAVSTDYRMLARISGQLVSREVRKPGQEILYGEISASTVGFDEVWKLRQEVRWEDLMLFGSDFQKKVWRKLWELTHIEDTAARQTTDNSNQNNETPSHTCSSTDTTDTSTTNTKTDISTDTSTPPTGQATRLVSYSDFAELCQNRAGVRAVAHAIGLNPVSVIIPCHLVIPKEGIDKIREIHNRAQSTIFKGDDLCIGSILADTSIDFGEYALGKSMKRELIIREITEKSV